MTLSFSWKDDQWIPTDHIFHRTYIQSERKVTKKYAVEDWSERDYICGIWSNKKKWSKNPNKNFASYKDCDDQYLSKICNQEGLFPICLNDFEKVTKQKINMALIKE